MQKGRPGSVASPTRERGRRLAGFRVAFGSCSAYDAQPLPVTESARAHSYFLSKQVQKTRFNLLAVNVLAVNSPLPLYIVSKSVLHARYSVDKCIILSV